MIDHDKITLIRAREILDSRGNPTVEAEVFVKGGIFGRAAVPSGKSTGKREACELRDKDRNRYNQKGVLKPVENVNNLLHNALKGKSVFDQREIDYTMIAMDHSQYKNKAEIGANATLAVSLATARAAAELLGIPLYRYLGGVVAYRMPVAMINVINGGQHAQNNLDIQEFMLVPTGFTTFSEALRAAAETFYALREILVEQNLFTGVGDEGGYAPNLPSNEQALRLLYQAVQRANYEPGKQFFFAIDVAANDLWNHDSQKYQLKVEKLELRDMYVAAKEIETELIEMDSKEMIEYYERLLNLFPGLIVSIEDALHEDDWDGWKNLNMKLGDRVQLVGDDLFVTNPKFLQRGLEENSANAILIKLNQIGTLTETLETIAMAQRAGWGTVISHRSGETEDTFIADLAVASSAGQIKTGSMARSERIAKYNQLLRIEESLGQHAKYINPYSKQLAQMLK